MHVPLETLPLMMLVIFAGYVVFGMTGFGASPITIPVLAHFLPLPFVLALCSVLDLAAALLLGYHTRRDADGRELLALLPFTLAGQWDSPADASMSEMRSASSKRTRRKGRPSWRATMREGSSSTSRDRVRIHARVTAR